MIYKCQNVVHIAGPKRAVSKGKKIIPQPIPIFSLSKSLRIVIWVDFKMHAMSVGRPFEANKNEYCVCKRCWRFVDQTSWQLYFRVVTHTHTNTKVYKLNTHIERKTNKCENVSKIMSWCWPLPKWAACGLLELLSIMWNYGNVCLSKGFYLYFANVNSRPKTYEITSNIWKSAYDWTKSSIRKESLLIFTSYFWGM